MVVPIVVVYWNIKKGGILIRSMNTIVSDCGGVGDVGGDGSQGCGGGDSCGGDRDGARI